MQAVKEDLNADTSKKWDLCNATLSKSYIRDPDGSIKDYESILRAEMFGQNRLRVVKLLLFSGLFLELNLPSFLLWEQSAGWTK